MRLFLPARLVIAVSGLVWPSFASDVYEDEQGGIDERPSETGGVEKEESEESLSAGGLEAPDALPEGQDQRSDIERELDEAEEKDAGRGLEFAWLSGEFGYETLYSIKAGTLFGDGNGLSGSGFVLGAGAGLRVLYFTLGARFRHSWLSDFQSWSLVGEAGLRVPLGMWEPYATLAGGLSRVPGLSVPASGEIAGGELGVLRGFDLRLGGGVDIYLSDSFSVGAAIHSDFLFLRRKAAPELCVSGETCALSERGTGISGGLSGTVLVGLHF